MSRVAAFRPRRSCLYMPGANTRALEKARTLPADVLILDLEDAVAPDAKDAARATIASVLQEGAYGDREVIVRANARDTAWSNDDIAMAVSAGANGVLLPKVETATDIQQINALLDAAGAPADFLLWAMIEMPLAILNIQEIAAASEHTRLAGFMLGTNDLAKAYGAVYTPDRFAFQVPLMMALTAARAYGLVALDSVYNDFKNPEGLLGECEQGRVLGFDGKTLIHPAQIDTANTVFSPDPDEVAQARLVIDAFSQPENQGKGVIQVDGAMVELLHLEQAQQLVNIDAAIKARSSE
ncbi:MAG: CoA ester lyase [Halioglobus sp.]